MSFPAEALPPAPARTRHLPLLLLLPSLVFLTLVFAAPMAYLVRMSFNAKAPGREIVETFTLENYGTLLGDPYYWGVFATTFGVALTVTVICAIVGFPLAVAYARARGAGKLTLAVIVLGPLLVNAVVRTYGWLVLLANRGLLNQGIQALGLTSDPVRFIYNPLGVVIGLVHVFLPFMVLSIAAAFENVDPSLAEAAETLGASKWTVFRRVTLPLTMPGVVAGSILVFSASLGAFVTPLVLGGTGLRMLVVLIYTNALVLFHWPRSAALAMVLLAFAVLALWLQSRWHREGEGVTA